MNKATKPTKSQDIKREWQLLDAKSRVLGRLATQIAGLLMGRQKPYFVRNLDCGDYVVAINASQVKVTGKKLEQKTYYRHSGYPKGLKAEPFKKWLKEKPEQIIIHAVRGMLPQNKLRDRMLRRLHVFAGEEHPYKDKFKVQSF